MLKNTLVFVFFTDIACLKNLIIFFTILASSIPLGDNLNWNVNGLSCGPWNSNSRLGLRTVPVALDNKPWAPTASPASATAIACLNSGVDPSKIFFCASVSICKNGN